MYIIKTISAKDYLHMAENLIEVSRQFTNLPFPFTHMSLDEHRQIMNSIRHKPFKEKYTHVSLSSFLTTDMELPVFELNSPVHYRLRQLSGTACRDSEGRLNKKGVKQIFEMISEYQQKFVSFLLRADIPSCKIKPAEHMPHPLLLSADHVINVSLQWYHQGLHLYTDEKQNVIYVVGYQYYHTYIKNIHP